MAISRDNRNEGFCYLDGRRDAVAGVSRRVQRVRLALGTTTPPGDTDAFTTVNNDAMFLTPQTTVNVAWTVTGQSNILNDGALPITIGVGLIADDSDVAGNMGHANVVEYVELFDGTVTLDADPSVLVGDLNEDEPAVANGTGSGSFTAANIDIGTYKVILVAHQGAGATPSISNVNTDQDYYNDSDGYSDFQSGLGSQAHWEELLGNGGGCFRTAFDGNIASPATFLATAASAVDQLFNATVDLDTPAEGVEIGTWQVTADGNNLFGISGNRFYTDASGTSQTRVRQTAPTPTGEAGSFCRARVKVRSGDTVSGWLVLGCNHSTLTGQGLHEQSGTLYYGLSQAGVQTGGTWFPISADVEYDIVEVRGGWSGALLSGTPWATGDDIASFPDGRTMFIKGGSEYPEWTSLRSYDQAAVSNPGGVYLYANSFEAEIRDISTGVFGNAATLVGHANTQVSPTAGTSFSLPNGDMEIINIATTTFGLDTIDLHFRKLDSNNYMRFLQSVGGGNTTKVYEVVAGVSTQVASLGGSGVRSHYILQADGNRILVYTYGGTQPFLSLDYTTAVLQTNTGVELVTPGSSHGSIVASPIRSSDYDILDF